MLENSKEIQSKLQKMTSKVAMSEAVSMINLSKDVRGVNVLAVRIEDTNAETLKVIADTMKDKAPNIVAVLAAVNDGKINFVALCGKEALKKGAHAGKVIKEVAAMTGGGGGGKPDMATAGGKDISKLEDALEAVNNIVDKLLG